MENKNVPSIRFKGFIDDWEQRKLGEAVTFLNGRAYKQKELLDKGKYRVLRVGNFNTNDFWYYSDLELEDNKYANKGDLLYLWATNFGPEIWKEERVIYHYHIWKLDINDVNLDKNYLYTWLITDKERIKQTTNGTTMVHITKGGMEERLFQNPTNIDEQIKIGNLFEQLDESIALQECELELLKLIKKGFLQQLFTVKDEKYPNLRFANFLEKWEQRKLGEFYYFKNGLNKEKGFFGKGTPIINFTDVFHNRGLFSSMLNGKVTLSNSEIERYKVEKGDLFFTRTSETIEEIGMNSVMLEDVKETVFSGFVLRGRAIEKEPLNNLFKKYVFSTHIFRNEMIKKSSMTTRALTSGTALKEMFFSYPADKDEQEKIGSLLTMLENKINFHEQQVKKLKKIKKSFLQKMFI